MSLENLDQNNRFKFKLSAQQQASKRYKLMTKEKQDLYEKKS